MKISWPLVAALKLVVGVLIIGALLVGMLSACSNSGRSYVKSEMAETLEVEIRPNTSKMFTYRLRWPEALIPNHIRVENGSGSSRPTDPGGISVGRGTYERLLRNTAYVVERAGYCREGFLELDRSISRYHLWIKGECKEGATAEDQQKFGAQKILTQKDWLTGH